MLVDGDELRRQSARPVAAHARRAAEGATELAGRSFNLIRPSSCGELLFEELKLPALVKTPEGQPSTNEEALIRRPAMNCRGVIRNTAGWRNCAAPTPTSCRRWSIPTPAACIPSYHQVGAATAASPPATRTCRTSRSAPRTGCIRRAFVAPEGRVLVSCDHADRADHGAPVWDPALVRALKQGHRHHRATAAEVFAAAGRGHPERTPRGQGDQFRA